MDSTIEKIKYDLDGNPRVYDAKIDIGPYEYQQKDTVNNKPVLYDISKTMKYPQDSSIQFGLNLINEDSTTKVLFLNSLIYGSVEYLGNNIVKYTSNNITTSKTESINIKVIDTQNDTSNEALISIDIIKKAGILSLPKIFNNEGYTLKVYPNPSVGRIMIEAKCLNSISKKHVKIYDIFGTLKEHITIDNLCKKVDVSNYPKGIYFVELYENNKLQARTKFVKVGSR